jgi:hypothetical protein
MGPPGKQIARRPIAREGPAGFVLTVRIVFKRKGLLADSKRRVPTRLPEEYIGQNACGQRSGVGLAPSAGPVSGAPGDPGPPDAACKPYVGQTGRAHKV